MYKTYYTIFMIDQIIYCTMYMVNVVLIIFISIFMIVFGPL